MPALMYKTFLTGHVLLGAFSLLLFWCSVLSRKGSPRHIYYGRLFTRCMYLVTGSAFLICMANLVSPEFFERDPAFQPMSFFLLALTVLTFAQAWMGEKTIVKKQNLQLLQTPFTYLTCGLCIGTGAALAVLGIYQENILFIAFGLLTALTGLKDLRFVRKNVWAPQEWLEEHISSMLGAGIAAHTAFLVFGGRKWLNFDDGMLWLWIAPSIIGAIAISQMKKRYVKR
ncbi:MAG: hypothetical protein AB7F59_00340 [Bdellovibrionales bacterium]